MRIRRAAALSAAAILLVACGSGEGEDGQGAEETPDQTEAAPTSSPSGPAGSASENVEDGVFTGQGVILPIPDGWVLNEMAIAQGIVGASPEGDQQSQQLLAAIDGINENEQTDFAGMDLQEALESYRDLAPSEPAVDEETEFEGAESAHQLVFEDLPGRQEGQPTTNQLIILAEDSDGQLGLFNYVAPTEEYDQEIVDQLLAEGGLDPDSEPQPPPAPSPPPTEGGGDGEDG